MQVPSDLPVAWGELRDKEGTVLTLAFVGRWVLNIESLPSPLCPRAAPVLLPGCVGLSECPLSVPGFLLVLTCTEVWDSQGPDPDAKQYLLGRKLVCRMLTWVCPARGGDKPAVAAYLPPAHRNPCEPQLWFSCLCWGSHPPQASAEGPGASKGAPPKRPFLCRAELIPLALDLHPGEASPSSPPLSCPSRNGTFHSHPSVIPGEDISARTLGHCCAS